VTTEKNDIEGHIKHRVPYGPFGMGDTQSLSMARMGLREGQDIANEMAKGIERDMKQVRDQALDKA
jgi:hypothetical protein